MPEKLINDVYSSSVGELGRDHTISQNVLCPFHDDTTPSMRLDVENNIARCFSCRRQWTPDQMIAQLSGKEVVDSLKGRDRLAMVDSFEREILNSVRSSNLPYKLRVSIYKSLDVAREIDGLTYEDLSKLMTIVRNKLQTV